MDNKPVKNAAAFASLQHAIAHLMLASLQFANKARDAAHHEEMQGTLHPSISVLCKLGSIVVHVDEATSPDGHQFDTVALKGLIADPEVSAWLDGMRKAAFLPVKRNER